MKDFKEVFTPPFNFDGVFIYDAKNRISINALLSDEKTKKIVSKLNGTSKKKLKGKFLISDVDSTRILFRDGKGTGNVPVLLIRGWGRLTGTGGLFLPEETAVKLQDDFAQWIVETLNS